MLTKLVSMVDFVLNEQRFKEDDAVCNFRITNYAHFLSQKLTLGMFVPTDENGNVLKDPWATDNDAGSEKEIEQINYNNAKSKVLFEGCKAENRTGSYWSVYAPEDKIIWVQWNDSKTIESLIYTELTLTETATKQIYG